MNKSSLILRCGCFMGLGTLVLMPGLALGQSANGSITFGRLGTGGVAPIPTLGGTMLILLALLLGFLAYRSLRKGHGRGDIASLLAAALAIGSLVSVTGGFTLLRDAYAVVGYTITDAKGQSFVILPNEEYTFENITGVTMLVTELILPQGCAAPEVRMVRTAVASATCELGAPVTNSAECGIDCRVVVTPSPK